MPATNDWTTGPAKWAAVLVLGSASVVGVGWSVLSGHHEGAPPSVPAAAAPAVATPDDPAPEPAPGPPPVASHRVNLNTASASELELLPGIGPALAARIIEYRRTNGAFRNVDGLDEVKGIGPRTLEKLRPLVTVE